VSCWLLQQWNLPEGIWHAIGGMPRHADGTAEAADGVDLARVLHLADVAAQLLSESREERAGKAAEILTLVRDALGIDEAGWTGIYDQIVSEWKAYGQLLSVKAGTELSFADLQAEAQEQMTALSMATQKESAGIKQQNQKLQEQARVDALTALSNRAAFNERLRSELERARRTERPLVLFMIDVDHFKAFNDTYGHQVGDRVLQLVAGAIRGAIRTMDFAARYGGEEFAVIAPECAPEGATVLGERLRGAVEKTVFTILGKRLQVTVSIGGSRAQWPGHAKTEAELIGEADAMLYEAKHAGRNCYRASAALQQAA
jgi:diguanylate cyclase (GGDEF)-like protein